MQRVQLFAGPDDIIAVDLISAATRKYMVSSKREKYTYTRAYNKRCDDSTGLLPAAWGPSVFKSPDAARRSRWCST